MDQVEGDVAWVICAAQKGCRLCAEGRGCGGGLLGRMLGDRLHRVRALSRGHSPAIGDRVELSLSEAAILRATSIIYGIPLMGFIGVPVLLHWFAGVDGDWPLLLAGTAGLITGFVYARFVISRSGSEARYQPVITRLWAAEGVAETGCSSGPG